jgi:hypothetical protein
MMLILKVIGQVWRQPHYMTSRTDKKTITSVSNVLDDTYFNAVLWHIDHVNTMSFINNGSPVMMFVCLFVFVIELSSSYEKKV